MSLTSPIVSGTTNQESNTTFHFDNLSYIGYYPMVKGSMLNLNFGFNYSRIKSFEQRYSTSKQKMKSSLTDYMLELTDGVHHSTWTGNSDDYYNNSNLYWLSILAWDGYLINEKPGTNNAYESILHMGELVDPSLKVTEKGKIETYDFTIGSNISNQYYWGATISITDLSYLMTSTYDEKFSEGGGFALDNYLNTKGSGIQLKLGFIYRPTDAFRLGFSYHTPTWYTMTDHYQGSLIPNGIYDEKDKEVGKTETPFSSLNYYLRTPGSFTFSIATVLGTQAILSLDYENKNYSSMNLKDDRGNDWKDVNGIIKDDYKNTSTIRLGAEYRFTPQFSGRAGYAWAQNPYRINISSLGEMIVPAGTIPHYTLSNCTTYLTAGLGFRFTPQFYGDFALVHRSQNDDLYYFPPLNIGGSGPDSFSGTFTNKSLKGLVTLGYKF
jgi:hypothetical protein